MEKIVVAYDGSEHADRALDRAAKLASAGTELVVVCAARLTMGSRDPERGGAEADPIESEWARENLDKARARLGATAATVRTVEGRGDPADTVLRQAEEEGADLIVVGTRGLNFAQRALLGSVSTKIVHNASCDVLVVR